MTTRRKPTDELRAALAGLALQGMLANPDISGRALANMDPDGESTALYLESLTLTAVKASGMLLEELNK